MKKLNFLLVLLAASITAYAQINCTIDFDGQDNDTQEWSECSMDLNLSDGHITMYWSVSNFGDTLASNKYFKLDSFYYHYTVLLENVDSIPIYFYGLKNNQLKYKDSLWVKEDTDYREVSFKPENWDTINKIAIYYEERHVMPNPRPDAIISFYVMNINVCYYDSIITQKSAYQAPSDFDVQIYPNPFKDYYKINISSNLEYKNSVEIYNMYGEKIKSYSKLHNDIITVDMSSFPNGIYFNTINAQGKREKIIKVMKNDF